LRYPHRQRLIDRLPDLSDCRQRAQRPRRSYLQPTELAVVLDGADELDRRARGLDWEKVRYIRASPASAVALRARTGRLGHARRPGAPRRDLEWHARAAQSH